MKVVIDTDRCTGHGRCYVVSPSLFSDDDAGFGQIVGAGDVDAQRRADAERAVNACPEQAITIVNHEEE
jgi:ferredoxin